MLKIPAGRVVPQLLIAAVSTGAMLLGLTCGVGAQPQAVAAHIAESPQQVAPLQAGEHAPAFSVLAVDNAKFEFAPTALDKPAVIIAFRGGWCPYCNMHLSELRDVIPQINAMGVEVLFLSGDRPELLYASLEADTREAIGGLAYRIYSDANADAAIALGIAFTADAATIDRRLEKGEDIRDSSMLKRGVLPVPAVFVIDRHGIIRYSFAAANYKVRLPADTLLAVVTELVQ
jgi:peroxiredoxin